MRSRRGTGLVAVLACIASFAFAAPAGAVAGFGDVRAGTYYTDAVQWMVAEGITTGTSPSCFSPDDPVTRGQAAAFLWRMEGEPDRGSAHGFVDVTAPWQHKAVAWMAAEGITTGTSPITYSPDDTLTRGQLAALIHRLAGLPAAHSAHGFWDVVAAWQQVPVSWMVQEGITTGTSPTTFSPDLAVTRGQLATFLHRYRGKPAVEPDPSSPACPGGGGGGGGGVGESNPVTCDIVAGGEARDVWFDLYYDDHRTCDAPNFVATGTTYYVDRQHPSRSDANPGTETAPWRTIVHAARKARPGDVVLVKAGWYADGEIESERGGVIYAAYPGDEREVVVRGDGFKSSGNSDLVVYGFKFEDIAEHAIRIKGPGASNIVVAGNHTYETHKSGISIRGVSGGSDPGDYSGIRDVLLIGNLVELSRNSEVVSVGSGVVRIDVVANELDKGDPDFGSGDEGISFKEGVRDSRIFGNVIHDLSDKAISLDGGSSEHDPVVTNIEIFDNILYNNASHGLWVTTEGRGDVDGVHVHHNIAFNNAGHGFFTYDHSGGVSAGGTVKNVVFEHNIAFHNGAHSGYGGVGNSHPGATGVEVRDNIAWNNAGDDIWGEPGTLIDNNLCGDASVCEFTGDPRFALPPFSFVLNPGSPAIGTATDGGNLGAT